MRIAITAGPYLPVPRRRYGGIARVVDRLARSLAAPEGELLQLGTRVWRRRRAFEIAAYGFVPRVVPHAPLVFLGRLERISARAEARLGDRAVVDGCERLDREALGR